MGIRPFIKKNGITVWKVTCEDRLCEDAVKPTVEKQFPIEERIEAEGWFIFRGTRTHRAEFAALTFEGVANGFICYKRQLQVRAETIKAYEDDLQPALLRFGKKRIDEVTAQDLRHLHDWSLRQAWIASKVNALTLRVEQVLKFARSQKAIATNPMDEARLSFTDYEPAAVAIKSPRPSKMDELLTAAEPCELLVLCLIADMGLSPKEVDDQLRLNCNPVSGMMFVPHRVYEGDDPNNPVGRRLRMTERTIIAMLLVESELRQAGKLSDRLVPAGTARSILRRLQLRVDFLSPDSEKAVASAKAEAKASGAIYGSKKDSEAKEYELNLKTRYDADDFRHVAALRYIAEGKRTKQLSILMALTIEIISERYGYELEKADGPSTIEATRNASNLVLDKIAQLGLGVPQAAQVPTNVEIIG